MADSIRQVEYYYTTVADKPGEGARVLARLRDAGVNLAAFHAFPSARKSQLDFVPSDPAGFLAAAKSAGIKLSAAKHVLLVEGDDRRGAIAGLLERLAGAKINVTAGGAPPSRRGRPRAPLWGEKKGPPPAGRGRGRGRPGPPPPRAP